MAIRRSSPLERRRSPAGLVSSRRCLLPAAPVGRGRSGAAGTVDAMETSLPRLRRLAVSVQTFRRLALSSAFMLTLIVASGATVRLTDSGLGCKHWPGCTAGDPFPSAGYHSYIEFGNRVVASLTILATLAAFAAALLLPSASRWVRVVAGAAFVGTLGQAPLGAITVYYHLNPWLVLSHFLLSLVVMALGVSVALEAFDVRGEPVPRRLRQLTLLVGAALAALIVSGTLATAAGPHSGGSDVRRIGTLEPAVWLHVRAVAVFGVSFALLTAWLAARRSQHLRRSARRARAARRRDGDRRGAVPHPPALGARARPRRARGGRLGGDGRLRRQDLETLEERMSESELRLERRPALDKPVMICSFRGWNDGGQGASLASSFLSRLWNAEQFGDIDPELFFDFQSQRPHVALVDGNVRRIDWPENSFRGSARCARGPRRAAPARNRAEPALAHVRIAHQRPRTRPRRLARRDARIAARRRPAHPARAGHRERDRSGAAARARAAGLALRGADRGRRGAPRRLPGGRDPLGVALGGGSSLRLAHAFPARREVALRPDRRPARRAARHERARGGEPDLHAAGERGRRLRRGHGRLRRRAREPGRRGRARGRPTLGRRARRGAHALPARARGGRGRRRPSRPRPTASQGVASTPGAATG